MNLTKPKIMTEIENVAIRLGNHVKEKCEEYIYLGHLIKLGKENQTAGIN